MAIIVYTDVTSAPANMTSSQMIITRKFRSGESTINATKTLQTFTGQVWLDPVMSTEGLMVDNVTFTPCARTFWHRHEGGVLLQVFVGAGWVCDRGGIPQHIESGDVVWCPPGTVHWHGADDKSMMVQQAISHGKIEWYDAVTDEEYGTKAKLPAMTL